MEERPAYNAGIDLEMLIRELPAGLDRCLLRVLSFRRGRVNAISRANLVTALHRHGFKVSEREARACINQLRKAGYAICSTGGREGGYWMAADWEELNEYIERELRSRAMDLLEQEKALRQEGERRWGRFSPGKQMKLFG